MTFEIDGCKFDTASMRKYQTGNPVAPLLYHNLDSNEWFMVLVIKGEPVQVVRASREGLAILRAMPSFQEFYEPAD